MGTVKVPRHIRLPEKCPGKYCHRIGAQAHLGTGMVPGQIWAPECAQATIGTVRVPGHIQTPVGCPETYGYKNEAQENIGRVPRHMWTLGRMPGLRLTL